MNPHQPVPRTLPSRALVDPSLYGALRHPPCQRHLSSRRPRRRVPFTIRHSPLFAPYSPLFTPIHPYSPGIQIRSQPVTKGVLCPRKTSPCIAPPQVSSRIAFHAVLCIYSALAPRSPMVLVQVSEAPHRKEPKRTTIAGAFENAIRRPELFPFLAVDQGPQRGSRESLCTLVPRHEWFTTLLHTQEMVTKVHIENRLEWRHLDTNDSTRNSSLSDRFSPSCFPCDAIRAKASNRFSARIRIYPYPSPNSWMRARRAPGPSSATPRPSLNAFHRAFNNHIGVWAWFSGEGPRSWLVFAVSPVPVQQ
jgi:hypothetical protein